MGRFSRSWELIKASGAVLRQDKELLLLFPFFAANRLAAAFGEAGFTAIATERISTVLHYDRAADACGAAFEGGPVALAYSRFDGPTREAAHAAYLVSIEWWRSGETYDIPGEFVLVAGRK